MALVAPLRRLNAIRYICRNDGAIDLENSDRELYESDPMKHADALKMKAGEDPTVFILNFEVTGRENSMIKDSTLKGIDDDKNPMIAMGKWAYTVAKICIKGIENPPNVKNPYVEFKKDGKGYIAENVLDKLSAIGVIDEIWSLFIKLREGDDAERVNSKN